MNLRTVEDVLSTPDNAVFHLGSCGLKTLSEIKRKIFVFLSAPADVSMGARNNPSELMHQLAIPAQKNWVINDGGWQLPPNIKADLNTSLDHVLLSPRARAALKLCRAKLSMTYFSSIRRNGPARELWEKNH